MSDFLQALYDRAIAPISEEAPCGEKSNHDTEYSAAKTEVMKMTSSSSGMDWGSIISNCDTLLTEKTKDLTIVAYLMLALSREHDYPGLQTGLRILDYFIENYWENMFPAPRRMRARIQLFEWINDRISIILLPVEVKPEFADSVRESKRLIDELPEKIQPLIKQPIGFAALRRQVNGYLEKMPAPAPVAPPKAPEKTVDTAAESSSQKPQESSAEAATTSNETVAAPSTAAPPSSGESMAPVATVSEIGSIKEGLSAIVKVIQLIREEQPDAAVAYRLARVVQWDSVEAAPPAGSDGKTRIPAPRDQAFAPLEIQLKAKNWKALRQTAENNFLAGGPWIFNLNMQRYVYMALQGLGALEAAETVHVETGRILVRFPELVDLCYSSGLEFADGQTKDWCADAVIKASPGSDAKSNDDKEWQDEIKSIAQKKNVVAALEIVQNSIDTARNKREAAKRQLFGAQLCITHGNFNWAVPILESLSKQLDDSSLMNWEPQFCSEVWGNLLKGYNVLKISKTGKQEDIERQDEIRRKLYDVDLVKAVSVTPKK